MPPALRRRESGQRLFRTIHRSPGRSVFPLFRDPFSTFPRSQPHMSFERAILRYRLHPLRIWVRFFELVLVYGFGFECAESPRPAASRKIGFVFASCIPCPDLGSSVQKTSPADQTSLRSWVRLFELVLVSGSGFERAKSPWPAVAVQNGFVFANWYSSPGLGSYVQKARVQLRLVQNGFVFANWFSSPDFGFECAESPRPAAPTPRRRLASPKMVLRLRVCNDLPSTKKTVLSLRWRCSNFQLRG